VLLRLAYLTVTNTFTFLRLLPMGDREKDIEILALRHQLLVLQRQVDKPAFTDTDRAVLAGLLHHLPTDKLRHSCCWSARTRSCTGIATCSSDATRRPALRNAADARPPSALSAPWSCAWPARTAPGDTAESTANSPPWASTSPSRRSGRACASTASHPHPNGPAQPGPTSYAARPTHFSRATCSRPAP
jgi:hypothetical protein